MRLIDADALGNRMYHESFEKDSDLQRWDGGCWIRYKLFEQVLRAAPTIDTPNTSNTLGALDCVSRQDAIKFFTELWECIGTIGDREEWEDVCVTTVNEIKSVQQKKGKWIYGEHDVAMCDGYRCDKCGFFVPWDYQHKFIDFIKDYNYCPSCGAKMEVKND